MAYNSIRQCFQCLSNLSLCTTISLSLKSPMFQHCHVLFMDARFPGQFWSSIGFEFPEEDGAIHSSFNLGVSNTTCRRTGTRTFRGLGVSWLHDIGLGLQSPDSYMNGLAAGPQQWLCWLLTISQLEYEVYCTIRQPIQRKSIYWMNKARFLQSNLASVSTILFRLGAWVLKLHGVLKVFLRHSDKLHEQITSIL